MHFEYAVELNYRDLIIIARFVGFQVAEHSPSIVGLLSEVRLWLNPDDVLTLLLTDLCAETQVVYSTLLLHH